MAFDSPDNINRAIQGAPTLGGLVADGARELAASAVEEGGNYAADTFDELSSSLVGVSDKLEALYADKYKGFFLQYPRNVEDDIEERHWIRFDVQQINGQQLETPTTRDSSEFKSKASGFLGQAIEAGVEKASAVVKSAAALPGQIVTTTANDFLNDVPLVGGAAKEFLGLKQSRARGLGSVLLYAPFTRTDTAGFQWKQENTGLAGGQFSSGAKGVSDTIRNVTNQAAGYIRGGAADSGAVGTAAAIYGTLFASDVVGKGFGNFATNIRSQVLRGAGAALNNHLESFFEDVKMRSFTFEFQLSPRTPEEAQEIQQIIKMFKYAGHPAQYEGLAGVFFAYPQVFDIEIFNEQQTHKIGTSALTGMSTVYGGDTRNHTFYDKHPVQVTLSLQFTELEILDKDKIDRGY